MRVASFPEPRPGQVGRLLVPAQDPALAVEAAAAWPRAARDSGDAVRFLQLGAVETTWELAEHAKQLALLPVRQESGLKLSAGPDRAEPAALRDTDAVRAPTYCNVEDRFC
jgi:hypothetical protein